MIYRVNIIESERGWGQKIDESKDFLTYEAAKKWADNYNEKYNPPVDVVPDWYMYADDPFEVK